LPKDLSAEDKRQKGCTWHEIFRYRIQ
jgi:hypothetical protein